MNFFFLALVIFLTFFNCLPFDIGDPSQEEISTRDNPESIALGKLVQTVFLSEPEKWYRFSANTDAVVGFFLFNPHVSYRIYLNKGVSPLYQALNQAGEPLLFKVLAGNTYYLQLIFNQREHQTYQYTCDFFIEQLKSDRIEPESGSSDEEKWLEHYSSSSSASNIPSGRTFKVGDRVNKAGVILLTVDGGPVAWNKSGFKVLENIPWSENEGLADIVDLSGDRFLFLAQNGQLGITAGDKMIWLPKTLIPCENGNALFAIQSELVFLSGKDNLCWNYGITWYSDQVAGLAEKKTAVWHGKQILKVISGVNSTFFLTNQGVIEFSEPATMLSGVNDVCLPLDAVLDPQGAFVFLCSEGIFQYQPSDEGRSVKLDLPDLGNLKKFVPTNRGLFIIGSTAIGHYDFKKLTIVEGAPAFKEIDIVGDDDDADHFLIALENGLYSWSLTNGLWQSEFIFWRSFDQPFIKKDQTTVLVGSKSGDAVGFYLRENDHWSHMYPNGLMDNAINDLLFIEGGNKLLIATALGLVQMDMLANPKDFSSASLPIAQREETVGEVLQLFSVAEQHYAIVKRQDNSHFFRVDTLPSVQKIATETQRQTLGSHLAKNYFTALKAAFEKQLKHPCQMEILFPRMIPRPEEAYTGDIFVQCAEQTTASLFRYAEGYFLPIIVEENNSLSKITTVMQVDDGRFIFGGYANKQLYLYAGSRIQVIPGLQFMEEKRVTSLKKRENLLYVGTHSGLYIGDLSNALNLSN